MADPTVDEDEVKMPEALLSREPSQISSIVLDETGSPVEGLSRKPDTDWLEPALATHEGVTVPLFNTGDRIVIERYCHQLAGSPWLDTQTYQVDSIDDETGDLCLWNPDLLQRAMGNFLTGPSRGDKYLLAPVKGFTSKRKRGRPRKDQAGKPADPLPAGAKKGRGRPKGSKNRSKEVIAQEKLARREELKGSKQKRGKR